MALVTAIQPDGQRTPVEEWAYHAWTRRELADPLVAGFLARAVELRWGYGWPRPEPRP